MLILTRKTGERVRIHLPDGTDVWVEVVTAKGGKVVLGFEGPTTVRIFREEVLDRQPEKENA